MAKKVFISREQTVTSPFRLRMEAAGYEVIGRSLIHFKALPFSLPAQFDWVFFYSKKSVEYFFEGMVSYTLVDKQLACIGKGTAAVLETFGYIPDFTGNGKPEEVAEAFSARARESIVLFPQAEHSLQSIQKLLGDELQSISLVVYKNEPLPHFTIPSCDVLVFTSPMNVSAYLALYTIEERQTCVAIGHTTAETLKNHKVKNIVIAEAPKEEKMAEAVLFL